MRATFGSMAATDDLARLAAAMVRPGEGYLDRIDQLREALAGRHGEASRQLGAFAARLAGLSVDELQELFDETFDGRPARALIALSRQLIQAPDRVRVLDVLLTIDYLLPALEADRNPFVYLFKAICCVLLARPASGPPAPFPMERASS
jgi:nitrate reductase assembly molybdenum cofactor insertion protein NarJ